MRGVDFQSHQRGFNNRCNRGPVLRCIIFQDVIIEQHCKLVRRNLPRKDIFRKQLHSCPMSTNALLPVPPLHFFSKTIWLELHLPVHNHNSAIMDCERRKSIEFMLKGFALDLHAVNMAVVQNKYFSGLLHNFFSVRPASRNIRKQVFKKVKRQVAFNAIYILPFRKVAVKRKERAMTFSLHSPDASTCFSAKPCLRNTETLSRLRCCSTRASSK